jgi:hypothetical protein
MAAQRALGAEVLVAGLAALVAGHVGHLGAQRGDAGQLGLDPGHLLLPQGLGPLGLLGEVADHEPAGRVSLAEADLLDPQVVSRPLVALARQRRRGIR